MNSDRRMPLPTMQRTIRGLIFDCDGLIVDTEMPAFRAWQEIYEEHGCSMPLETWATCLGGSGSEFDACEYLEQQIERSIDRSAIRARRLRRKRELAALETLLPGVLDYIRDARRLGLKLAVASSSPRDWVTHHLDRLAILAEFDHIVCSDDVAVVKPDPELFLAALAGLGVRADEAIIFEDSPNGITAARAAGVFCVAVPNALTCRLPIDHADLRLASLADMPLATLLERVEGVGG